MAEQKRKKTLNQMWQEKAQENGFGAYLTSKIVFDDFGGLSDAQAESVIEGAVAAVKGVPPKRRKK